jgi:Rieske Fe-S protein
MYSDRKEFLKKAGSVALFASLGIQYSACSSSTGPDTTQNTDDGGETPPPVNNEDDSIIIEGNMITLDISSSQFGSLQNRGGMVVSGAGGFLAVNVDGSTVRAFTNVCTHAGCSNDWVLPGDRFVCTCHNSVFNLNGQPTSGPANRDLTEYQVSRDGNTVVITKS